MALRRDLTAVQATALNMIDMVGIGPFVTTALVASTMGFGPYALLAWLAGAALCVVDAAIWSELGAKMPEAGGTYAFLRESYGRNTWGRLMAFLFTWQTTFQAPLVVTSGALGFAKYLGYVVALDPFTTRLAAVALIVLLVALLYRRIAHVGAISVVLWVAVMATMLVLIVCGLTNIDPAVVAAFTVAPSGDASWPPLQAAALGAATISTVYSYLGYYNVCHLGAEVKDPVRIIPRSMYVSIAGIAAIYMLMQMSIYAVVPFADVAASPFIVSTFFERLYGADVATAMTALVLVVAVASLFSVMLGYTRIPYAAAKDGLFFSVFGRLHPTGDFPHVALLVLGGLGIVFSLTLTLDDTIKAIITMRVFTQFIAQAVGLVLLRRRVGAAAMPWRMWLYPVPVVLVIIGWLAMYASAKPMQQVAAIVAPIIGSLIYVLVIRRRSTYDTP
ncbi:MAG: APC family permease [Candidatus Kapabacteria bacterium]|nr:APC family permease [Candidatus Kapabacteria bacterium]